ncbi:MAG: PAS domain-containing protein [Gammaproteobacteria bacterium]|nr:PAS domain-containing protein [Gammaproteobacteria bacterium]NIM72892.1 PAS domain-containing protein [Gammaproteobacteria bacterium]NIN38503.1 PAS domain-containing protein [Gammaproteobacteria bacterium]NIO24644.1 PAS domain-containing protein [Gammaproteobacteria bacterium]NIO65247.1 PAS domain-containing protein [Gammaproteobacteria bacterium]
MSDFPLSASDCQALLAGHPAGIVLCDASDQVVWANQSFCELLETEPDALIGAPMSAVLGREPDPVRTHVDRYVITSDSGRSRWLECALSQIDAGNGQVGSLRIFTDVSAFESRQKGRVATAAGRDPSRLDEKSGLLNRQAIVQELSSQVSRSRRYGNDLSLVQVRFAPENGVKASEAWQDTARRRIAECLEEVLRWADFVGTLSPCDVLVILPECGEHAALGVIRKVEATLADGARFKGDDKIEALFATTTWDIGDDPHGMLQTLHRALQASEV